MTVHCVFICSKTKLHKTDKVFAHYANHIKKESALETIAKTSEKLFAPIFEELSITDIEYSICDEGREEAEEGNERKLISLKSDGDFENEREITSA